MQYFRLYMESWKDTLAIPAPSYGRLKKASTICEVLQVIVSVFHPLGYFSPTVLMAKLFIQELWKEKWEWDTNLNDEKWHLILQSLECISQHAITRNIKLSDDSIECTLLCLYDASAKVYAAVIYIIKFQISQWRLIWPSPKHILHLNMLLPCKNY